MADIQDYGKGAVPLMEAEDMQTEKNSKAAQPILYILSSGASALLDVGVFYIFQRLFGDAFGLHGAAICNLLARAISSFFNYNVNRSLVFRSHGNYASALLKYYCLAIPVALASTGFLTLAVRLFEMEGKAGVTTATKIIIDGVLYVINFIVQKFWVFSGKEKSNGALNTEEIKMKTKYEKQDERNRKNDV